MMNNNDKKTNLGDLLLHFRRNILESIKRQGIKHELTFSQIEVLNFIGVSGEKTMKSIAEYLMVTPPSVTEIIREMEKKNLVRRLNNDKDRRIVSVVLTSATKNNFISISKNKESILNQMVHKLNQKDRRTLERIIKIIITA